MNRHEKHRDLKIYIREDRPRSLEASVLAGETDCGLGPQPVRQPATLGPDGGDDYWRQWYLPWDATPGAHSLAVRATSGDGETQTAVRATPFPAGSSGVQETRVQVA